MLGWVMPFFIATLPFCLWASWSDLKFLKIPNILSIMLALVFVILGPIVLPFDDYLFRLAVGLIAFVVGFVIYFTGTIGGGDLKLIAAMLPFVAPADLLAFAFIVSIMGLAGIASHRLIGKLGLAPAGWKSWDAGRKYPFGMSLAGSLMFYNIFYIYQAIAQSGIGT